jgi:hypothetical protein
MMRDAHTTIARRTAARLAEDFGESLPTSVEQILLSEREHRPPWQFGDPGTLLAVASLIVSIAQLGWSMYQDLKAKHTSPPRAMLEQRLQEEARNRTAEAEVYAQRITLVVIEEILLEDQLDS